MKLAQSRLTRLAATLSGLGLVATTVAGPAQATTNDTSPGLPATRR